MSRYVIFWGRGESLNVTIQGTADEIAALVVGLQGRQAEFRRIYGVCAIHC